MTKMERRPTNERSWKRRLLMMHAWGVYAFLYGPIAILVIFSFNRSNFISSWEGFSLRWYAALWQDDLMRDCIANSLIIGALATLIATSIGTMAALAMSRGRFPGKTATSGL